MSETICQPDIGSSGAGVWCTDTIASEWVTVEWWRDIHSRPSRRISPQELALTIHHAQLTVIRRLFDEGWDTTAVLMVYDKIQRVAEEYATYVNKSTDFVDYRDVAVKVYRYVTGGE